MYCSEIMGQRYFITKFFVIKYWNPFENRIGKKYLSIYVFFFILTSITNTYQHTKKPKSTF